MTPSGLPTEYGASCSEEPVDKPCKLDEPFNDVVRRSRSFSAFCRARHRDGLSPAQPGRVGGRGKALEQGAGFIAQGWARVTGSAGVCLGTRTSATEIAGIDLGVRAEPLGAVWNLGPHAGLQRSQGAGSFRQMAAARRSGLTCQMSAGHEKSFVELLTPWRSHCR